jgi:DNA polymerase elongation subunit (family B)
MRFKITDSQIYHEEEDGNMVFMVQLFGIDEKGVTYSAHVSGYKPIFYCKVPEHYEYRDVRKFVEHLKEKRMPTESIVEYNVVRRKKLFGFDGECFHKFMYFKFDNMKAFYKVRNLWYEAKTVPVCKFYRDGQKMCLRPSGYPYQGAKLELYEANIPPLLRFYHVKQISPSGWVRIAKSTPMEKTTTCVHEVRTSIIHIEPLNEETRVPYKVCSFDIEASSSHGDFPLAIKDYKRLAQNIVDTSGDLQTSIDAAFGFTAADGIDLVYPKEAVSAEDVAARYARMMQDSVEVSGVVPGDESPEEDEEVELARVEYKGSSILAMLADPEVNKPTKVLGLTAALNKWFPPLEGDTVTFIGTTFSAHGSPGMNHCIVLGGCEPVEGAELECYATEREVLVAWTELMTRENPDVVIGYNIFGFDEEFMFKRSLETGCVAEFLKLTRCLEGSAGKMTNGKWGIEEKSVYLASGEYNLNYFNLPGRVHIDLYTLFRRDYNFESYKLDSVASMFIGGKIIKVAEHDETGSAVYSDCLRGLAKTNYVVFEVTTHSASLYKNGQKFKVKEVYADHFTLDAELSALGRLKGDVRWCLAKDDVDHHAIFKLAKGSDADRATIAAYCIQDCNLVQHLFERIDVLTSFVEMSNLCSVPISFLVFRGQGIKLQSYIAKKCREASMLMPVLETGDYDQGYEGAIVLDPKCGIYTTPVAVTDYASLYPSTMIAENLSHDSKVWTKEYDLEGKLLRETGVKVGGVFIYDNLPGYTYIQETFDTFKYVRKTAKSRAEKVKAGSKVCRFAQFKGAIMPSVLKELLKARKNTRRQIKTETDEFMRNVLDKRQLAYKVTANSLYGQCGAKTSSFYEMDVAASCTACGRKLLIYAKTIIEEIFANRVCETAHGTVTATAEYVYGDTDSVFFKYTIHKDGVLVTGQAALDITIELAKEAGRLATMFLKPPHDLEYEKTFWPLVLLSKKRYVGMMYADGECERKSMGIVLKRRDNASIVKDIYGGVIDILMNGRNIPSAVVFVKESLALLREGKVPFEKLMISKSLRSAYKNPGQIAHKVLADRIGVRDPGNKPRAGDRIQYMYVQTAEKKKLQGDKIETPEFIKANGLVPDYTHYVSNQIMKPLLGVFELVDLAELPDFNREDYEKQVAVIREKYPTQVDAKVAQLKMKVMKRMIFEV